MSTKNAMNTEPTDSTRFADTTRLNGSAKASEPTKSRRLGFPLRVQFLIIALSLAIISTILGLSVYMTDTDTYQVPLRDIV